MDSSDSETRKQRLGYGRHASSSSSGRGYGRMKGKLAIAAFVIVVVVAFWQLRLEHHIKTKPSHSGAHSAQTVVPQAALPMVAAKRKADSDARKAKSLMLLLVSDSPYQNWQMRLFHYQYLKTNQTAKLVTIVSSGDRKQPSFGCHGKFMVCPLFVTNDYSSAPDGDYFVVYNRAWALVEYLTDLRARQAKGIDTEYTNIIIVEPDFLLTKPITAVARRRSIVGHSYFYMERSYPWSNNSEIIGDCTQRGDLVTPIGVPYIIHAEDLWQMLPAWIEKTRLCRKPQRTGPAAGERSWIADMWAFACAAASLGFTTIADPELAPEPPMDRNIFNRSIAIHYTYGQEVGNWKFDKRKWNMVPQPRPLPPFPPGASPLQIIWRDLMNDALVNVFGEAAEHPSLRIIEG